MMLPCLSLFLVEKMRLSELFEEAQIVFKEEPHIVHAQFELGGAFNSDAEGESLVLGGIVPHRAQHIEMNHARAQNLDPSALLAHAASGAAAH
jgi:hypothetical protein